MIQTKTTGAFLTQDLFEREKNGDRVDIGRAELLDILFLIPRRYGHYPDPGGDAVFVLPQQVAFVEIVDLFEQGFLREIKLAVILIFYIVQPEDDLSAVEAFVVEQIGTMNALQQDGVIVFEQPVQQLPVRPGTYNIRKTMGKAFVSFVAAIIMHLFTVFVEDGLSPATVLETMQMYPDPRVVQRPDLMEQIKDSPIVHRVGDIQADDM
jgi:hypothetical protein